MLPRGQNRFIKKSQWRCKGAHHRLIAQPPPCYGRGFTVSYKLVYPRDRYTRRQAGDNTYATSSNL